MPFPSRGCQTCKSRRIKCDENRPYCLRCVKSKRICDGMGGGQGLAVIHIENQYASGQKKRPRGPRSAPEAIQVGHPLTGFRPTSQDLHSLAVAYYVRFHLQSPTDNPEILKSLLHCIPQNWTQNIHHEMLDLAVSSKALATFARTQRCPPADVEATLKYRKLLCLAHQAICHLNKESIDACLLVIFFMSRYEGVIHPSSQQQSEYPFLSTLQSFAHHDGAFAILKTWKYRFSHIQAPSEVIKLTRRGLLRSALLRALQVPHWMQEGDTFGESGLDLDFDQIIVRIANVRHRLIGLLADKQVQEKEPLEVMEDLCNEAQGIDESLQQWSATFPTLWSSTPHTLSKSSVRSPQRYIYSSKVYSYASPAFAGVWAKYYATRMLILSTWITSLGACHPSPERVLEECRDDLRHVADDLASSLPFCLQLNSSTRNTESGISQGSVKLNKGKDIEPFLATLIVWPLSLASSLKHVEPRQQTWFRSVLAHLGRVIGVSMLECANTDRWPII